MLTIKNYHKLCNKPVGGDGWHILFCGEQTSFYEIKMVCTGKKSVTIFLGRKPEVTNSGSMAYMFRDWNYEPTNRGVTSDWIRDMDNLLKALRVFTS
jgi:hypothetical protein